MYIQVNVSGDEDYIQVWARHDLDHEPIVVTATRSQDPEFPDCWIMRRKKDEDLGVRWPVGSTSEVISWCVQEAYELYSEE